MAIPVLYLPLDGTTEGLTHAGVITPETRGPLRYVDHPTIPGRQALWFEEGTTNYVMNPRAAYNLNSISTYNTPQNITHERLAGQQIPHPSGITIDTAVRVLVMAATTNMAAWTTTGVTPTSGATFTAQCLIRGVGSAIGKTARLVIYEGGGPSPSQFTSFSDKVLTGQWQQLTTTGSILKDERAWLNVIVQILGGSSGDEIIVTAAQLEAKPYATSYAAGDLGDGYAWTGAAHASMSTREGSALRVPWADIPGASTVHGAWAGFIAWPSLAMFLSAAQIINIGSDNAINGDHIDVYRHQKDVLRTTTRTNQQPAQPIYAPAWTGDTWSGLVMATWLETTQSLYIDDLTSPAVSATRPIPPLGVITPDDPYLYLGAYDLDGGQNHNGYMSDVVLFNAPPSPHQRAVLRLGQWQWETLFPRVARPTMIPPEDPFSVIRQRPNQPLSVVRETKEEPK